MASIKTKHLRLYLLRFKRGQFSKLWPRLRIRKGDGIIYSFRISIIFQITLFYNRFWLEAQILGKKIKRKSYTIQEFKEILESRKNKNNP